MYFIILTTALTLHKHGITNIDSSKQAAEALRPLAGTLAYLLYTIGIIGSAFSPSLRLPVQLPTRLPKPFPGKKAWMSRCGPRVLSMPS
jgi:hypothetical protein